MSIKRTSYDVEYLDSPGATPREYRVRVIMADRLQTEMSGRKYGLLDPPKQPQLCGLLWLWFASLREGHVAPETTFAEFQTRCIDNGSVEVETVDPTEEESNGSSSLSNSAFPASTGGAGSSPVTTG